MLPSQQPSHPVGAALWIMRETTTHRANYKWIALGIAATSTMLGTSDFSIVLIALPTLTDVFSAPTSTVIWVSLGFQLISLGLVLPAGRFGDLFGIRRVFVGGMLVYAIGMLLAGLAPGIWLLIVARMVQSAGAAMSNALSTAIVTTAFPRAERGKALGILMSAAGVGMMIGPSLGGLMLGTLGWRWIFLIRVPLALGAFALAVLLLEKDHARENKPEGRFDIPGSITLFFAACAFAIGVNRGSSQGFGSLPFLAFFGTSVLLISTFIIMTLRSSSPVIDLRLFKRRAFAIGSGLMVASTMTVVSLSFLMPFYLIIGKSLSPASAGLVLLAGPTMMITMSPITGRLSDRFGPRVLTPLGLVIIGATFYGLSTLNADAPIFMIAALLATSSLGSSLFNPANQSAIMGAAPPGRMGTVSGLIPTLRNIGLITGIATAEAIFVSISGWSGGSVEGSGLGLAQRELVIHGIAVTLRVFGAIAIVAALLATTRGEDPHLRKR
jgi:EmrB/QacA subfamily drug resistance transporter